MSEETTENLVGVSLVDWLATKANMPESVIRREIVTGNVKINGQVIDNPAVRLANNSDVPSTVELGSQTFLLTKE